MNEIIKLKSNEELCRGKLSKGNTTTKRIKV